MYFSLIDDFIKPFLRDSNIDFSMERMIDQNAYMLYLSKWVLVGEYREECILLTRKWSPRFLEYPDPHKILKRIVHMEKVLKQHIRTINKPKLP